MWSLVFFVGLGVFLESLQSRNFSLNRVVSLCWVSLPNTAQSGRPWPFLQVNRKQRVSDTAPVPLVNEMLSIHRHTVIKNTKSTTVDHWAIGTLGWSTAYLTEYKNKAIKTETIHHLQIKWCNFICITVWFHYCVRSKETGKIKGRVMTVCHYHPHISITNSSRFHLFFNSF